MAIVDIASRRGVYRPPTVLPPDAGLWLDTDLRIQHVRKTTDVGRWPTEIAVGLTLAEAFEATPNLAADLQFHIDVARAFTQPIPYIYEWLNRGSGMVVRTWVLPGPTGNVAIRANRLGYRPPRREG
jgi:hypothetical protein